jgi:hypothetical protein
MFNPLLWRIPRAVIGAVLGLLAAGIVLALLIPGAARLGYRPTEPWIWPVLLAGVAAGIWLTPKRTISS